MLAGKLGGRIGFRAVRDGGFDRFQCSLRRGPAPLRFYGAPRDRAGARREARGGGSAFALCAMEGLIASNVRSGAVPLHCVLWGSAGPCLRTQGSFGEDERSRGARGEGFIASGDRFISVQLPPRRGSIEGVGRQRSAPGETASHVSRIRSDWLGRADRLGDVDAVLYEGGGVTRARILSWEWLRHGFELRFGRGGLSG